MISRCSVIVSSDATVGQEGFGPCFVTWFRMPDSGVKSIPDRSMPRPDLMEIDAEFSQINGEIKSLVLGNGDCLRTFLQAQATARLRQ